MDKYKCKWCKLLFIKEYIIKFGKTTNGKQLYSCNPCNTKMVRRYKDKEQGRLNNQEAHNNSIKKHVIKRRARHKLNYQIKIGNIIKPDNCLRCLKVCVPQGHHNDYSKPLEVDWLCRDCHRLEHRNLKYGTERFSSE